MIKLTHMNNSIEILTKCVWFAEPLNLSNSLTHTTSETTRQHGLQNDDKQWVD